MIDFYTLTKRGGSTFYLYTHAYPDGRIFYVGKGVGDRANDFFMRNRWHKGICKKIGIENVVVNAYTTVDERHALAVERQLILAIRRAGHVLCNLTDGGDNESGREFTDEHRKRLSEAGKGFKKSPETLEKMRRSHIGIKLSEAHKQKLRERDLSKQVEAMRLANIGKKRDPNIVEKIAKANKGRSPSPETREKMRIAKAGKKQDPEVVARRALSIREACARRNAAKELA